MKLSGVTFWEILVVLSMSTPFAFAQSYSAGGGSATGFNATAIGSGSVASGDFSSAYGTNSTASGVGSSAYGDFSRASGSNSTASGGSSSASGHLSSAYGAASEASGLLSSAYGINSTASGVDSVALGDSARASATNAVALGSGSVANQPNTVSVGSPGLERRITNVAPGVNPTDAVNMSQLSGLNHDIGNVASSAYRGIAGVAALTSGTPAAPGKTSINLGVGAYKGYAAGAITASHTTENGRFNLNGGVGITSGEPIYRAGVGFSF